MSTILYILIGMFYILSLKTGLAVKISDERKLRQGCCGLFELLCLSRRASKERATTARPGAQKSKTGLTG